MIKDRGSYLFKCLFLEIFIVEMAKSKNEFFIIVDPSTMLSFTHLQDLMKFLEDFKKEGGNFKVLLPQLLHSKLDYLERKITEEDIFSLSEVYQEWFPVVSRIEAEDSIRSLGNNTEYNSLVRKFRDQYSPENAELYTDKDIVNNNFRSTNNLFTKEEIDQKLPKKPHASRMFYQIFSASAKVGAAIASVFLDAGKGLWGLIKSLKKKIIEIRSGLKEKLKRHKNIKTALKFCIVVASYAAASAIYSHFGPAIVELIPIGIDDKIPGLQGAIQQGFYLIING